MQRTRSWGKFVLFALVVAGISLRILLIVIPRTFDDDTSVYAEPGLNLLHHGVYGIADDGVVYPSLIRLPGYPLFLGLLGGHFQLALYLQAALDLVGCWLLALFARRRFGVRVSYLTFAFGSLCIFTAAYAATLLTESLSIFSVSLAIYALGEIFPPDPQPLLKRTPLRPIALLSTAIAMAMLLRPDGVLLLFSSALALLWYGQGEWGWRRGIQLAIICSALSLTALLPWTVRNYRTFHTFQPLAPRHLNDPGEPVDLGFYRWLRTWSVEFVNTGNVYWNVNQDRIAMEDIPPRAYDSPEQYARTRALITAYNQNHQLTQEMDSQFAALAAERIHARPLRYYLLLPMLRIMDMWLRPRTEAFNIDVFWWRFQKHPAQSAFAVGLALLNLAYVFTTVIAFVRRRAPLPVLLGSYLLMRCILLGTMENPEPRYTLEGFPILILCAAAVLFRDSSSSRDRKDELREMGLELSTS